MTGISGEYTRSYLSIASVAWALLLGCVAQAAAPQQTEADEYRAVVEGRATKIVDALKLNDNEQATRVTSLIADFYVELHSAHEVRDLQLAKDPAESQSVRDASDKAVVEVHRRFVALLSASLTPEQVEQVKDGLTYGVVPITYAGYQRLLPNLTEEQQRMILANLLEAREYAMDAGSSHEKHAWFGKYKGRINNQLSAAGIDLKQAEKDLSARQSRSPATEPASR